MKSSTNKYPSKQEIVDRMEHIDVTRYLPAVRNWKDMHYVGLWRNKTIEEKMKSLESLAYMTYYHQNNPSELKTMIIHYADRYALHIPTHTILLNQNNPSILSTLHETGHAINGESEIEACAFSVKLFAKIFPKEYSRLEWHGHMLKLPA